MATPDAVEHPLARLLHAAFADLIAGGDVDVVAMPGDNAVEVQGDDWTLVLESWPLVAAWIALDESPASEAEQSLALDAALAASELAALRDADRHLDGALVVALAASGDGLSRVLALRLGETGGSDDIDQETDDPG